MSCLSFKDENKPEHMFDTQLPLVQSVFNIH
jgi:hypothetical protein